jgi:hypothetical protein
MSSWVVRLGIRSVASLCSGNNSARYFSYFMFQNFE